MRGSPCETTGTSERRVDAAIGKFRFLCASFCVLAAMCRTAGRSNLPVATTPLAIKTFHEGVKIKFTTPPNLFKAPLTKLQTSELTR